MRTVRGLVGGAVAALVGGMAILGGCGSGGPAPKITALDGARSPLAAIEDDRIFQGRAAGADATKFVDDRMAQMADLGARVLRVSLRWDVVAPARRPADPADPADPAYVWGAYDPVVAAARRHGIQVMFSVWSAPDWAADQTIAKKVEGSPPSWNDRRPASAEEFGLLGRALATRYAPRGVHLWEAWNEANINFYLRPQFERQGGKWVAASPARYSRLMSAFRENVRSVDPQAQVAGGVMAPVGDRCGLTCPSDQQEPNRIGPQQFLQALDAPGLQPDMDAVSHHPYPSSPPLPADAPKPTRRLDLYNLADLAPAIDATYLAGKPIWISEYGFQTEPTQALRYALSPPDQASGIVAAYATMVAEPRIKIASYYFLQDNAGFKSGLTTEAGAAKPGAAAYALPFAPSASDPSVFVGQVRPTRARSEVTIQWKSGSDWKDAKSVATTADGSFKVRVDSPEATSLRAHWQGTSPTGAAAQWTSPEVTFTPTPPRA